MREGKTPHFGLTILQNQGWTNHYDCVNRIGGEMFKSRQRRLVAPPVEYSRAQHGAGFENDLWTPRSWRCFRTRGQTITIGGATSPTFFR